MKRSIAVARLWLEVNTFSPVPTVLADFEAKEWLRARKSCRAFAGTPTELGAVEAFARENPGWDVHVLRCAAADPGGPMEGRLFDRFLADSTGPVGPAMGCGLPFAARRVDTQSRTTPDIDIVKMVRGIVGGDPDRRQLRHARQHDPEMATLVDVSAGYKMLPHLDMDVVAEKVLN